MRLQITRNVTRQYLGGGAEIMNRQRSSEAQFRVSQRRDSWIRRGMVLSGLMLLLVGVGGCEDARSTIEIRPRASLADEEGLGGMMLRVGSDTYVPADFSADDAGLIELSRPVPNSGMLEFGVELRQQGITVAEGAFSLEMHRNFEWGMDIFRQVADPTELCFGCAGVQRFEISAEHQNQPGEAMWVTWGGQERGSGIVY
jgi:hypothetical protein